MKHHRRPRERPSPAASAESAPSAGGDDADDESIGTDDAKIAYGMTKTNDANGGAFGGGGVIGGQAFYDSDNDGMRDDGARVNGAPDINVWLFSCDPFEALAHFKTKSNGIYRFVNLSAGEYFIIAQPPAGYQFSYNGRIKDDLDSTIDPETGRTICFQLKEGEKTMDWSFGLYKPPDEPSLQPTMSNSPTTASWDVHFHVLQPPPSNAHTTTVHSNSQTLGSPTPRPSYTPTSRPSSSKPTAGPSSGPASRPSSFKPPWLASRPSVRPSVGPISGPSSKPTSRPSLMQTSGLSFRLTSGPSSSPTTLRPKLRPSSSPKLRPSLRPTSGTPIAPPPHGPTSVPSKPDTNKPAAEASGVSSSMPTNSTAARPNTFFYAPAIVAKTRPPAAGSVGVPGRPSLIGTSGGNNDNKLSEGVHSSARISIGIVCGTVAFLAVVAASIFLKIHGTNRNKDGFSEMDAPTDTVEYSSRDPSRLSIETLPTSAGGASGLAAMARPRYRHCELGDTDSFAMSTSDSGSPELPPRQTPLTYSMLLSELKAARDARDELDDEIDQTLGHYESLISNQDDEGVQQALSSENIGSESLESSHDDEEEEISSYSPDENFGGGSYDGSDFRISSSPSGSYSDSEVENCLVLLEHELLSLSNLIQSHPENSRERQVLHSNFELVREELNAIRRGVAIHPHTFEVDSPLGNLGLVVDKPSKGGPVFVRRLHPMSPLRGQVQMEDKIMAINDEDVRRLSSVQVGKMLSGNGTESQRKILIVRDSHVPHRNPSHADESPPSESVGLNEGKSNCKPFSISASVGENAPCRPEVAAAQGLANTSGLENDGAATIGTFAQSEEEDAAGNAKAEALAREGRF